MFFLIHNESDLTCYIIIIKQIKRHYSPEAVGLCSETQLQVCDFFIILFSALIVNIRLQTLLFTNIAIYINDVVVLIADRNWEYVLKNAGNIQTDP